jgi:hypothetical protein
MRNPYLVWFWAIVVAFVFLAMPATTEQGKQQCKQEQSTALCCRVIAKGDNHPPQWMTMEDARVIWTAVWIGAPNMHDYRWKERPVSPPKTSRKECHTPKR